MSNFDDKALRSLNRFQIENIDLQGELAAKNAEIEALIKERDFFFRNRNSLADENRSLKEILRRTLNVTYVYPRLWSDIHAALKMSGEAK